MKKQLFLITVILSLGISPVFALTTSTPSATPEMTKNKQIEDLKDRLATKVAELRRSERRAIEGTVKTKTISTLTVETEKKDIKIELTDDIKVFQMIKDKRTTLKIDNVEKGDVVVIFGDYDTTVEILKAKVIVIENTSATTRIFGTITDAKKADYTLTVMGSDNKTYTIDFETTTKTSVIASGTTIEKGGFSKLLVGDTVTILGTLVPKKENRISAIRILDIGNTSGTKPTNTPTPTEKVSSDSAKTSATKTPTPKP